MKQTALVIMAAGMGSRFGGGIKQLEPMGPNGEIIMDYSIYDAIEAGFNKVVFVTRKDLLETFKEVIGNRIEKVIPVEYAFQEIEDVPEGFEVPAGRTKPWGTGQAILACKGIVTDPFLVINADDYYGKTAFKLIHDYLVSDHKSDKKYDFCMAGFILGNTLSDNDKINAGGYILGSYGGTITGYIHIFAPAGGTISDIKASNGGRMYTGTYHDLNVAYMFGNSIAPGASITITYKVTTAAGVTTPLGVNSTPTLQNYR